MSTTPRYDPAELESRKWPFCICKEHPDHQRLELKEMDWTKVRDECIEYCVYAAIEVFHGDKICGKVRQWLDEEENPDYGPEHFKSKYGDYELQPEIIHHYRNPMTGEYYDLCRVTLVGYPAASDPMYHKLIIGEACSTAAAAVESVEQNLHMVQTWEEIEDIVIEVFPVVTHRYSWKKCSVCYNIRRQPVTNQPVTEQPQASR